jgi:hypothetical protein
MKFIVSTLAAFILGTSSLFAVEIREMPYSDQQLPETIYVGGISHYGKDYLKPWVANDPAEYAGKYTSLTITEGIAHLDLKMHVAKSGEGDPRWHVDGTILTKAGAGVHHVLTFKNAEVCNRKLPNFDVVDRIMPGIFVIFTDPEYKDRPMHGVVIDGNVFVRISELEKEGK